MTARCCFSVPAENIRKPKGFLMFSGGIENEHRVVTGQGPRRKHTSDPVYSYILFLTYIVNFIKILKFQLVNVELSVAQE